MNRTRAWENLNNPEYAGGLNMSEFYDLLISAGYSEREAHKAASERGWDRLQAGIKI